MARVKYGAVIVDSRGSVGGMTFKVTRAGPVMQKKSTPTLNPTRQTTALHNSMARLAQRWSYILTDAQRTAWTALALGNPVPNQWGDTFPLSGPAFFNRTNLTLLAVGAAEIDSAPADQSVTAVATLSLDVTAPDTAEITFTPTPTPANHRVLIAASYAGNAGVDAETQHYTFLIHGDDAETSPLNVSTEWLAKVGPFINGKRYSIKAVHVNTENGARSAELATTTLATP